MNTNLNFLSTPTVLPNGGSPLAMPTSADGAPQSQVFQALLTGQMFKAERQGLAAQVMEDAGLQVISLGAKLNVITTDEPLPDLPSLAAFARTQGLAETAIQALFGSATAAKTSMSGLFGDPTSQAKLFNPSPNAGLLQGQESAATLLNLAARADGFEPSNRLSQAARPMPMPMPMPASISLPLPAALAAVLPVAGLLPTAETAPVVEVQAKPAPGSASLLLNSMLFAKPPAPSGPTPATKSLDGLSSTSTNPGMADPASSSPAIKAQPATISTNGRPDKVPLANTLIARQTVSSTQTVNSLEGLSRLVTTEGEPKTDGRDKKTLRLSAQDQPPTTAASASALLLTSLLFPNSPAPAALPDSKIAPTSAPTLPTASALPTVTSIRNTPTLPEGIATARQPGTTAFVDGQKPLPMAPITPAANINTGSAVGATALAAAQTLQATQAPDALAAAQVLAGSISAAWAVAKSATSSQAAELGPHMRLDASAEESVQDAVRLTLSLPAPDLSKRLSSRPGNTEVLNWAPLLANQQPNANKAPASGPWENLNLAVPEGFDLEEQEGLLAALEQDSGNNAGQPTQAGPLARGGTEPAQTARGEATLLAAQAELRTVQQQQLADRLGEAAANRLIAQIERGEWKMQMRLQPGKLGRIDVELSMHARGLEAMFSADSALTRELIVQGTARLKETLAQAGMTVASMTVNGDQARQSGGNSTPQQGYKAASDALPTKARVEEPRAVVQTPAVTATDRLNILA